MLALFFHIEGKKFLKWRMGNGKRKAEDSFKGKAS
jgi:hypothetical protein